MRDQRDPQLLGEAYLRARGVTVQGIIPAEIQFAVQVPVPPYRDNGFISSNPAEHHSKTPQNIGSLDDGGAT